MRRQLPGEQEIGNLCLPAPYRNSRNRRILFNYSLIKGKMRERRYDTSHEPVAHSPFPCVNPTERWGAKKIRFHRTESVFTTGSENRPWHGYRACSIPIGPIITLCLLFLECLSNGMRLSRTQ